MVEIARTYRLAYISSDQSISQEVVIANFDQESALENRLQVPTCSSLVA